MQCHFCMHFNAMAKDQILNIYSIRMKTKHTSFTKLIVLLAAIPILILLFSYFSVKLSSFNNVFMDFFCINWSESFILELFESFMFCFSKFHIRLFKISLVRILKKELILIWNLNFVKKKKLRSISIGYIAKTIGRQT